MTETVVPRVLLIAGPIAAGKTTLAARIAETPGWTHLSEDLFWVMIKAGRPPGDLRTAGEQAIVWRNVLDQVQSLIDAGRNVVLEFILYETPPRPLLAYEDGLSARGIPFKTRILRPEADEILRRMRARGRPGDADSAARRRDVDLQLSVLMPPHIPEDRVIDTTHLTVEETFRQHFAALTGIPFS